MQYKILIAIMSIFLLFNQQSDSLNDRIYKSHKKTIKNFTNEIETQHVFREKYINDIIELIKLNPTDTIVIAESHKFNCDGCPASFVQVFTNKTYKNYRIELEGNKYTSYSTQPTTELKDFKSYNESINGQYLHYGLMKIIQGIRSGKKLSEITEENNTENCHDGSKTIYTLIFPNDEIDCMRIRCWVR
jgi:hypothetical protein